MNTQKIKFNDTEIEVQGCYPYLVSPAQGKVVLTITVSADDTDFDTLHSLADNESGIVELYERTIDPETGEASEWVKKNTYDNYNSGDVAISYTGSQYKAEVTRVDGIVRRVAQLKADIDYVAAIEGIDL